MTTQEAAAELGVSLRAIQDRIKTGAMTAERVGARGWLISRAEVERWKAIGRLRPGPKPRSRSKGK